MKKYKNFLNEVGEANVPPYKIDNVLEIPGRYGSMSYNYYFNSESGLRYDINISRLEENSGMLTDEDINKNELIDEKIEDFYTKVLLISFFTFTGKDEDVYSNIYDSSTITNKGEMFRVMSTLKEALSNTLKLNPDIKYLLFGGALSKKGKDKEQRERLYMIYIKRNYPKWEIGKIYCTLRQSEYNKNRLTK